MNNAHHTYMQEAIKMAQTGIDSNAGGPFGAIVVKEGVIISRAFNQVTSCNDPTAHAEVTAIREACKKLETFTLEGCSIYTSCEPCPMCLGAIYWAHISKIYYACTRKDAAEIDFDDQFIYEEISKDIHSREIKFTALARPDALQVFRAWKAKTDKIEY